ncbi:MAG: hypothetical protein BJ554DRAFT_4413, partial [Olpidium bornovanus]
PAVQGRAGALEFRSPLAAAELLNALSAALDVTFIPCAGSMTALTRHTPLEYTPLSDPRPSPQPLNPSCANGSNKTPPAGVPYVVAIRTLLVRQKIPIADRPHKKKQL